MWPLDVLAKGRRDVLRIGRERVELWESAPQGLMLRGQHPLDGAGEPNAAALRAALRGLLHEGSSEQGETGSATSRLDAVIESAWLPVMLLDVGQTLWSRGQVEALLRHRLTQLYGDRDGLVCDVQLDHRAGDAVGLGYGLAPSVKQVVLDAVAAAGIRLASLQPAFAWGWQRLARHRRKRSGWWVWMEQDRSLIGNMENGRVSALNAGAMLPRDEAHALRLIEFEAARHGASEQEARGVVAGWHRPAADVGTQHGGHGLSWVSVAAPNPEPLPSTQAPLNAGSAA